MEKYELEALMKNDKKASYTGYGILIISEDIDEELLFQTVNSIKVKGKVIASKFIKEHYHLK